MRIVSFWNNDVSRRLIDERFSRGAVLWLFKCDAELAGYGWTLNGGTMEPHFVPLGKKDVHLFDFFVFPEYRGRRINPSLVNYILSHLAEASVDRVFIEVASWNVSQLSSLSRTPFRIFGFAIKWTCFGCPIVIWKGWRKLEGGTD